ncbi:MAG: hypothetical protein JSS84_12400 [Bacteroidetes bacterium]|nr:hypothetical protein [Bacteroidota bacterium]
MTRWLWPLFALAVPPALAQQGFLPLSRTVDGPWTALMHRSDVFAQSSIRPYLREDLINLPGADSVTPPAAWPWLQRLANPANRWHGGPLADALAGPSLAERDAFKYRAGAGAWLEWNATPRWTLEADLQGWSEQLPDYLDRYAAFQGVVPGEGAPTWSGSAANHYAWSGYADYKAGSYFHLTLGKGQNFFGEGYRSLLLGDEATSYPYFRITTTAWHIRYVNLYALMRNTPVASNPYPGPEKKFTSMHYLSWNISKRVNAGFFDAVVWQDNDPKYPRGFDLSYVNPVIFLRPVEYGLGSPDNMLMGAALNVKVGRNTLLYSQLILDEFLLNHVRAMDGWYANKQGVQAGAVAHNAFRRPGLTLRAEVNYARPFIYTHSDSRQNYAHYGQPLAHPYGADFLEGLLQAEWRKGPWLVENVFSWCLMGQDTTLGAGGNNGNNIFLTDSNRPLLPNGKPKDLDYRLGDPVQVPVVQNELRAGRLVEPRSGLMLELAWTFRSEAMPGGAVHVTNYLRMGLAANLHQRHPFQTVR